MKIKFIYVYNDAWWAVLSPVISKLENVDFSHCAILLETEDVEDVYEATWPRGKKTPFVEWPHHYKIKHAIEFDVPANLEHKVVRFLEASTYFEYSVMQLFVIALGGLNKWIYNKVKNWTWNGKTAQICTELHARFIEQFSNYKFSESMDYVGCDEVFFAVKNLKFLELEDKPFFKG